MFFFVTRYCKQERCVSMESHTSCCVTQTLTCWGWWNTLDLWLQRGSRTWHELLICTKTSGFMEYWGRAWADYIVTIAIHSQQCQWYLCTIILYGSTSTNNTQAVQCSTHIDMKVHHKTSVQSAHWSFLIHTGVLASCLVVTAPLSQ